jgi:SAM-dependent methyltransferase
MMAEAAASTFDDLAPDYDRTFTTSAIGRRMRAAVWRRLDERVGTGDRLLELNCGTGEDAVHLGARGVHVLATDASAAMVAATAAKVDAAGLGGRVRTRQLAIEALATLDPGERGVDAVLSDFGGLNCVGDLAAVGRDLAGVVRPGGAVLVCVMGPIVPWEWAWYLAHGSPRRAVRRVHGPATWRGLEIRYPSIGAVRRDFASGGLRLERTTGIGVLVPPSYVEPWAQRHARALDRLDRLERRIAANAVASRLAARLADHYLLEFSAP